MELLEPYLLLERPGIVATVQRTLRRQMRDLFVIQRIDADSTRVRGVLDGFTVTRVIKDMKPGLRRIAVLETGGGLDPPALFIGQGGRMLPGRVLAPTQRRAGRRGGVPVHNARPAARPAGDRRGDRGHEGHRRRPGRR
jgi:hypothetical protein